MPYRVLLLALFMSAVLLVACGSDEASTETPSPTILSPQEYLDLGIEHQEAEEFSPAVADFTSAIEAGLEGVEAHRRRGLSNFELARFQQVVDDLVEVTTRDFEGIKDRTLFEAEVYNKRAQAYLELGQDQLAIQDFDQAQTLAAQPLNELYYKRGLAKFNLGQNEAAIIDFDNAIIQGFGQPVAYMNRGRAKISLGQTGDGIDDFSAAISLDSQDAQSYLERGLAYFSRDSLDSYQEAINDFGSAISLNGELTEAYYNRGLGRLEIEQRDSAKEDFDDAIRLDPEYGPAYLI